MKETIMQDTTLGLIVILALGLLVLPFGADAEQTGKVVRIGMLSPYTPPTEAEPSFMLDTLRHALREQGWVEGQNLIIEQRFARGQYERLPDLAAELVRLKVDVLMTPTTPVALAAKHATKTIPIVLVHVSDPVRSGLVASLAQPGANVTGVTFVPTLETYQKCWQLFMEAVPQVSRVAVLYNPANPANLAGLREVEKAARVLGVPLHVLAVRDPTELEQAFHAITDEQATGLFIMGDPFLGIVQQRRQIAQFAIEHRLPTMCPDRGFVQTGGLMSYGLFPPEMFRRAAALIVKILRGTTPADLPVEQPMQLELVINLKTAKALGLTIPPSVLFQANEVIQ